MILTEGDVFLGMPRTRVDGGEFWPSAMAAIVSEGDQRSEPMIRRGNPNHTSQSFYGLYSD